MAITGRVDIAAQVSGSSVGPWSAAQSILLTRGTAERYEAVTLTPGGHTVVVPANATGVLLVPPTNNTNAWAVLYGQVPAGINNFVTSGIQLHRTNPTLLCLNGARNPPSVFPILSFYLPTGISFGPVTFQFF